MGWQLAPQVSYCWAQDQAVFLDVARDRYFGLPSPVNQAFALWMQQDAGDPPAILVRQGLLVPDDGQAGSIAAFSIQVPGASIRDLPAAAIGSWQQGFGTAFTQIYRARLEARFVSLEGNLRRMERHRNPARPEPSGLEIAAGIFARVRAWQPLAAACLPDSMALFDFLARQGHFPTLVFGVTARPFAAHCWVQTPDLLLNEDVDIVSRFTPILAL